MKEEEDERNKLRRDLKHDEEEKLETINRRAQEELEQTKEQLKVQLYFLFMIFPLFQNVSSYKWDFAALIYDSCFISFGHNDSVPCRGFGGKNTAVKCEHNNVHMWE